MYMFCQWIDADFSLEYRIQVKVFSFTCNVAERSWIFLLFTLLATLHLIQSEESYDWVQFLLWRLKLQEDLKVLVAIWSNDTKNIVTKPSFTFQTRLQNSDLLQERVHKTLNSLNFGLLCCLPVFFLAGVEGHPSCHRVRGGAHPWQVTSVTSII